MDDFVVAASPRFARLRRLIYSIDKPPRRFLKSSHFLASKAGSGLNLTPLDYTLKSTVLSLLLCDSFRDRAEAKSKNPTLILQLKTEQSASGE